MISIDCTKVMSLLSLIKYREILNFLVSLILIKPKFHLTVITFEPYVQFI